MWSFGKTSLKISKAFLFHLVFLLRAFYIEEKAKLFSAYYVPAIVRYATP